MTPMTPTRLTVKCAWHARAIEKAREAGLTWREIAATFGTSASALRMAYARAKAGIEAGKYKVTEQMPLPATTASRAPEPPVAAKPEQAPAPAPMSRRQSTKEFLATLEQIGGNKK